MSFGMLLVSGADGTQREITLDAPTAIVGRSDANQIVLDEISVSRRHARLSFDSGRLLVEDLGSAEGTFVAGERLPPHDPSLVEPRDELRFGDVVAYFVEAAGKEDATADTPVALPATAEPRTSSVLRIAVVAPAEKLAPGGDPRIVSVTVTNTGSVVDEVTLEVRGLPESWIKMSQASVVLLPGDTRQLGFALKAPRVAESRAGRHDFSVVATSQQTSREVLGAAAIEVEEFEAPSLELQPRRSKKHFRLQAANNGNVAVEYALSGVDDEQAFRYEFERSLLRLEPGESTEMRVRLKRPRRWAGHSQAVPFRVQGEPGNPRQAPVSAEGQLQVNPIFGTATFSPAAIMLVVLLVGMAAFFLWPRDDGIGPGDAEAAFDGVHLCDDPDQAAETAEPTEAPPDSPRPGEPGYRGEVTGGPFYAQNDPRWADEEYARAQDPEFGPDWCGDTISQCGCAMTSVATVLALYSLVEMPDGSSLSPETLNEWFNGNARRTERGWVSQGYIYGDVIWTAANQISAEMHAVNPALPTIRFVRTGSGSEAEIRSELEAGRPIILEVPGHWIAAVGIDNDGQILINDPFYRDRTHLDEAYPGLVKSSVLFEPSEDLSAVVFTAPSDVRMRITDNQGRVVGTLNTGSAEEAEAAAVIGIPGASYSSRQAWRDPTCIAAPPPEGAGTNQIVLPGGAEDYTVEIVDTEGRPASIAIHTYGQDGEPSIDTIETDRPSVADVAVSGDGSGADVSVREDAVPTPEEEVTQLPQEGEGEGDETPAKPEETATPQPTPTPAPLLTSLQLPAEAGQERIETASNDGFFIGDTIVIDPGTAIEETNTIAGFGSFILAAPLRFSHSAGAVIERIRQAPPGPDGSPPQGPPDFEPPPLLAPENLAVNCSTLYNANPKRATVICGASVTGEFTTLRWTSNGTTIAEASNKETLFLAFEEDTSTTIVVTACNITICRSTTVVEAIRFPLVSEGVTGDDAPEPGQPVRPPTPTSGVVVSCATAFNSVENSAEINCVAAFPDEPYTSITWSAPGANPPQQTGLQDEFSTSIADASAVVRVTATVCNFSDCDTSEPFELVFGETEVELAVVPGTSDGQYPQYVDMTLAATVRGPAAPVGGTVEFLRDGTVIGIVQPLIPAGDFGYASISIRPPTDESLPDLGTYNLTAHYRGGGTLFPGTSDQVEVEMIKGVGDVCDSIDNPNALGKTNGLLDEDCVYQVNQANPKNVGGGTLLYNLNITGSGFSGDTVATSPGQAMTIAADITRTTYCPGCIRQVYIALAGNETAGTGPQGPMCMISTVLPSPDANRLQISTANGPAGGPNVNFRTPDVPGVYYVRVTGSLQYSCISVNVGSPGSSVGRVVVQSTTSTAVEASVPSLPIGSSESVTFTATVTRQQGTGGTPGGGAEFDLPDGMVCTYEDEEAQEQTVGISAVPVSPGQSAGTAVAVIECDVDGMDAGEFQLDAEFVGATNQGLSGGEALRKFYLNSNESVDFDIQYPAPDLDDDPFDPASATAGQTNDAVVTITGTGFFDVTEVWFDADGAGGDPAVELGDVVLASPTELTATIPAAQLTDAAPAATIEVRNREPGGGSDIADFPITKASTTTTLNSPGSHELGDTVTFTGNVTESSTGSVNGDDVNLCRSGTGPDCTGGNLLGTGTITGGGSFSFGVDGLSVGNHSVQAYYLETANFAGSASQVRTVTITRIATTTTLDSPGSHPLGDTVTFTGDVSGSGPGSVSGDMVNLCRSGTGPACTGNDLLGAGTLNGSGDFSIPVDGLAAGSHDVQAYYLQTDDFAGSTSPVRTVTVTKVTPTVMLEANPTTADAGDDVTLTATVTQTGSFPPTGEVDFHVGTCGGTPLGTDGLNSSGVAEIITDDIPGGLQDIAACYEGDDNYNPSEVIEVDLVEISRASVQVAVAASPSSPFYNQTVTLTATVTESLGSADPTGNVTFCYGGTQADCSDGSSVDSGNALDGSGVATGTITISQVGSVTIRAYYVGDSNFAPQSDSEAITVQQATTTTTTGSSATTIVLDEDVTLTADVDIDEGGGTLSGMVEFLLGADASCEGGSSLGSDAVDGTGAAQIPESFNSTGAKSIRAHFLGSTNFDSSCGNEITIQVNNPDPTVSSITPDTAASDAGDTAVTIAGNGFLSGVTSVTFDPDGAGSETPVALTGVTIVSDTEITGTIPGAALAAGDANGEVVVTNSGPGGGSDSIGFEVT